MTRTSQMAGSCISQMAGASKSSQITYIIQIGEANDPIEILGVLYYNYVHVVIPEANFQEASNIAANPDVNYVWSFTGS
jgi:hypothetical protein